MVSTYRSASLRIESLCRSYLSLATAMCQWRVRADGRAGAVEFLNKPYSDEDVC